MVIDYAMHTTLNITRQSQAYGWTTKSLVFRLPKSYTKADSQAEFVGSTQYRAIRFTQYTTEVAHKSLVRVLVKPSDIHRVKKEEDGRKQLVVTRY